MLNFSNPDAKAKKWKQDDEPKQPPGHNPDNVQSPEHFGTLGFLSFGKNIGIGQRIKYNYLKKLG